MYPSIIDTGIVAGQIIRGIPSKQADGCRLRIFDDYAPGNKNLYLSDLGQIRVKVLEMNNKEVIEKLGNENITWLLQQEIVTMNDLYNLFPRKIASKAARHTLIFRPSIWTVENEVLVEESATILINLDDGTISNGFFISNKESNQLFVKGRIVIQGTRDEIKPFHTKYSYLNDGVLKSLLQKIIRTRAVFVTDFMEKTKQDALYVLRDVFISLFFSSGIFHPVLKRHITGGEAALKRLAVCILEDSYISNLNVPIVLFAGALFFREYRSIPISLLNFIIDEVLGEILNTPYAYEYSMTNTIEGIASLLLSELGSFEGDINLTSTIYNNALVINIPNQHTLEMPIEHCLDNHCVSDIAYYIDNIEFDSFEMLFNYFWIFSSSINPRRGKEFKYKPMNIVNAQKILWRLMSLKEPNIVSLKEKEKETKVSYQTTLRLNDWISNAIGTHEILKTIVTFNRKPIAIRKPIRGVEQETFFESQPVIDEFKKTKISLSRLPEYIEKLINIHDFQYVEGGDKFSIMINEKKYFLDDTPETITVSGEYYVTSKIHDIWDRIDSPVIVNDGFQKINNFLQNSSPRFIERLYHFVKGTKEFYSMYGIDRRGKKKHDDYQPEIEDYFVFKFFILLCKYFPSMIQKTIKPDTKFQMKDIVLWDQVRSIIRQYLPVYHSLWNKNLFFETRKLYDYQEESLNVLRETDNNVIIWIPPGAGKTAIITNYIAELIIQERMYPYCFYTLPISAFNAIVYEFRLLNIPIHVCNKPNDDFVMGAVNLIEHDLLRLITDKSIFTSSLFIIDEFHKTLNTTLRTSSAFEMASLSRRFIAMTGTLIKDIHLENLYRWFSLTCDFEVTKNNFWVALTNTTMINKRIDLPIKVTKQDYIIPYFPNDPKPPREHISRCYEIIEEEMIIYIINTNEPIFCVAKDKEMQFRIAERIKENKVVNLITSDNVVNYPGTVSIPNNLVVITTMKYAEGYSLSSIRLMITSVYFSNQATRTQIQRRIIRSDSLFEEVFIITFISGILNYIHTNYKYVTSIEEAIKAIGNNIVELI